VAFAGLQVSRIKQDSQSKSLQQQPKAAAVHIWQGVTAAGLGAAPLAAAAAEGHCTSKFIYSISDQAQLRWKQHQFR
jgi:hypothetical protein